MSHDTKNRTGVQPKLRQDAIANLGQDISATYVEAEVQAISTKVDAILDALRKAGIIAS